LEGGPPEFPQGFSCPGVLGWQGRVSLRSATGLSPSLAPRSKGVRVAKRFLTRWETAALPPCSHDPNRATPAGLTLGWFGLIRVRSPLLAESRLISLPRGTKMFQFPRFPSSKAGASPMMAKTLPHSGTHGSKRARRSPWHIAGRRALHRLLAPRHPPAALGSLIIQFEYGRAGSGQSSVGSDQLRSPAPVLTPALLPRRWPRGRERRFAWNTCAKPL